MKVIVLSLLVVCGSLLGDTSIGADTPYPVASDARVREVQDLGFGMWTCWSLSTFTGAEYTHGVKDPNYFHPTGCDVDQWVASAKDAGMKYILFLPKHHDGFCMWDTKTTDFNVMKSPLGRDVLAALRKACDRQGIKLALYWSMPDWTWPKNSDKDRQKKQLEELLTQYGPIEFIWMDEGGIGNGGMSHTEACQWIKKFQPNCLLGFNCCDPQGEIRIGEQGFAGPLDDPKCAGALWQRYLGYKGFKISEFCYPIVTWRASDINWSMGSVLHGKDPGARWFYTQPEWDNRADVSAETIYFDYLRAKKYGNLFNLDVSPNREGKLRDLDQKILKQVGKYIRGENPAPFLFGRPGFKTKASSVYNDQWYSHDPDYLFDGNAKTGWGPKEKTGWIEFDLGKNQSVSRMVIDEGDLDRIRGFEIQYEKSGQWITLLKGEKIGTKHEFTFPATEARKLRLVITDATQTPGIWEITL